MLMSPNNSFSRKVLSGALLALIAGTLCLNWDIPISTAVKEINLRGDFNKVVQLSETFGHATGPIAIFSALLWIDVANRKSLWLAAWFTAICGLTANVAKLIIPRVRPHSVDQSFITTSWHTWGSPWTGSWFDEQFRSFPAGHSATAVSFAIGLTYVYPRGKWIFATLAGLACYQRLASSAHFVSDIMGGVFIALVISFWFWKSFPSTEPSNPTIPNEAGDCQPSSPQRLDTVDTAAE